MRVCVLGAGVIGVTTAYFLVRDGHQVTVIDRASGPGSETSFANGGQISVSHSDPWASPQNFGKILRWLGDPDAPLAFKLSRDPALWRWLGLFLRNCTPGHAVINAERMLRIARYSQTIRNGLLDDIGLEHDQRSTGILHIYRDPKSYDAALKRASRTTELGYSRAPVSVAEALEIEPALGDVAGSLAGVIHAPDDQSGDAHQFTDRLATKCRELGVTFKFDTDIKNIFVEGGHTTGVATSQGQINSDAVVVSLGSYSPLILRSLGIKLPVYPAKGYSVTIPVGSTDTVPTTAIIDDENKIVYSRLGDRLRAAGLAETIGYDTRIDPARANIVLKGVFELFPNAGDPSKVTFWTGLRPQTPDSVPVLGKTPIGGLYLNTGHGSIGWSLSSGSGGIVADIISGKSPGIDVSDLGVARF